MKKKVMLTVPVLVLAFYGTSQITTAQGNCAPPSGPMPACQNGRQITINNNSKNISPRNICVDAGDTITVNVTPNGTTASIDGKTGGWPTGSGSSFQLVVPNSPSTYDYNVHFEDGSCIDPRITVRGG